MVVKPVEDFVFEGLVQRIQQTFNCPVLITTANDKTKQLARLREGKEVEYPYIFLTINSVAHNKESFSTNMMARRGLVTVVGQQAMTVRLMPTNFEIDVEFVTNKFQGNEQGTVLSFAKRWMFAQRCGYFKFNIMYGRLKINIGLTPSDTVATPPLENKVETETAYKVTTSMVVHGYVSEPVLGTQGIIQTLVIDEVVANPDGSVDGYQFIPF